MLRTCSLVGVVFIVFASASPTLAQKKRADSTGAEEAAGEAPAQSDAKPAKPAKRKPKVGRAVKGDKKNESSAQEAAATEVSDPTASEQSVEPDAWERPPADAERPPPVARAEVRERIGDGKHLSAGVVLGWGFLTDRKKARLGADAYGLALGARGGWSFDSRFYVGAFYTYYLGSTNSGVTQGSALPTTSTANYMLFGLEGGYDVWAGSWIVRPSLQVGAALGFTTKLNAQSPIGGLLIAPGVTVIKPIDAFFVGGDMRIDFVSGDGNSAFGLALTGGMRFE
jgi:hypothetical protein